ncbi:glycoside hydrolase superfamily [Aspergillus cavernicola]|uniref:Glycoside hydrolase superfamily n=1 Tax=Aspergillus cavernicola TaxID=176166 RepID=A0ABR4IAF7_9EURO
MKLGTFLLSLSVQLLPTAAANTPFSVDGRWILDSNNSPVTFVGVNWPGAGEAMIPEGLQYASIESTVSKIKSLGMNVIRLTFPIELVDDIFDNSGDTTVRDSFINALGADNGTTVFEQIVSNNPSITNTTTRLQVFDMVADECNNQGIYVHLDNHISKAMWCCSTTDGNAWFGDTYFDVNNWKRGLEYMALHAKSWPSFTGVGLRNELRQPATANPNYPYNWETWYTEMVSAAEIVNAANPNALIFLSGLNYDTTLAPIPTAADLGSGTRFRLSDFDFADKLVLELHTYDTGATSCANLSGALWNGGFKALDTNDAAVVNVMPVVLTEFGFNQEDSTWQSVYATCLRDWIPEQQAGWMVWTISGSYYIRQGTHDYDDTWGILDHTWSDWRNDDAIEQGLQLMVDGSL